MYKKSISINFSDWSWKLSYISKCRVISPTVGKGSRTFPSRRHWKKHSTKFISCIFIAMEVHSQCPRVLILILMRLCILPGRPHGARHLLTHKDAEGVLRCGISLFCRARAVCGVSLTRAPIWFIPLLSRRFGRRLKVKVNWNSLRRRRLVKFSHTMKCSTRIWILWL